MLWALVHVGGGCGASPLATVTLSFPWTQPKDAVCTEGGCVNLAYILQQCKETSLDLFVPHHRLG